MDNLRKPCIWESWDFSDNEDSLDAATLIECQARCQQKSYCHYWSFSESEEYCYLTKKTAYESGFYDDRYIAGPINCTAGWDCFYQDVVFSGFSIDSGQAASNAKGCQKLCQDEPQCEYWTYLSDASADFVGRECWMKSKDAIAKAKFKVGRISGPKNCLARPKDPLLIPVQ